MATDVERLVYQMSADIRRFEKSLDRATQKTDTETRKIERRFGRMNKSILNSTTSLGKDLRSALAGIGVAYAIRETVQYADAWTDASNKIAAAGVANADLATRMQQVADVATESRSALSSTADLYGRVLRSTQGLGKSQEDLLGIVETVNKAFAAGGAAVSEQTAGIQQLGQALGSGVLQGDELRSIRENAPILAQAIAKEFDTTIAGLKELGAEGELTSVRVLRAIENAASDVDAQFSRTEITIAQSVTNLETSFTRYIAGLDDASGASRNLAGFVQTVADNLPLLANAAIITTAALSGMAGARGIQAVVSGLRDIRTFADLAALSATRMGTAFKFLGGPLGILLGTLAAGLAAFALQGQKTNRTMDEIVASVQDLAAKTRKVQEDIQDDSNRLEQVYAKMQEAMERQAHAAAETARAELVAIAARKEANLELLALYRQSSAVALDDARQVRDKALADALRLGDSNILTNVSRAISNDDYKELQEGLFKASEVARRERNLAILDGQSGSEADAVYDSAYQSASIGAVQTYLDRVGQAREELTELAIQGQSLSEEQRKFLTSATSYFSAQEEVDKITRDLVAATQKQGQLSSGGVQTGLQPLVSGMISGMEALSKVYDDLESDVQDLYGTERAEIAQTLQDRIQAINLSSAADVAKRHAISRAEAVAAEQTRRLDEEERAERERARAEVEADARNRLDRIADIARARKSYDLESARDLAEASGDTNRADELERELAILAEMDRIRSLGGSNEIAIGQQAQASVDKLLEAERAIAQARQDAARDLQIIEDQLEIARAAGHEDEIRRLERILAVRGRIAEYEGLGYSQAEAEGLANTQQDGVDAVSNQISSLQRAFRDSFRNGVREGIATGDWEQALENVFADAATRGLERALDSVADVVFSLFKSAFSSVGGSNQGNIIGGAVSGIFSYAGHRASGGGVSGGSAYRVNEQGGEFLYMPKGQNGTVMTVDQVARSIGGGGGAVFSPQTSIVIHGGGQDVAGQIADAMNQLNRSWAAALPRAIDARNIDSQRRRRI